jgi:6-phosphogluconolactonase
MTFQVLTFLMTPSDSLTAFIGSYTRRLPHVDGKGQGIYRAGLNAATGTLSDVTLAAELDNPTFLAIAPDRKTLYAIGETEEFNGQFGGSVSAYAIDPGTYALTLLNRQPSRGGFACHLSLDATGRTAIVANYGSGSVAAFPIEADGRLGALSDFIQHTGSGPNPARQQGPHAHQAMLSPDNRFVFVNDLGADKVMIYALDAARGKLTPAGSATLHPGAGPRHLDFHPNGRFAFVINELDATLTAFAYDSAAGALTHIHTVPTLPPGATAPPSCADVHAHPNGRFVYGSNRNHDSIAIFAVDAASGRLAPIGHEPTQGAQPRNFALTPDGRFLLAENQDSDTIVSFRIDPERGTLTPTGDVARVPTPVCLKLLA